MLRFDRSEPVLVTGAAGYVAGWIVKRLLEHGLTVHATVRNLADTGKLAHLDTIAAGTTGKLRLFQADLLAPGSYDDAARGCTVVFHTASPFRRGVRDPAAELVAPALEGTRNVLCAASRAGTVRRVVLTSSCAAIYGDVADVTEAPGGVLTEALWNTTSSLKHMPYFYSKTVAERAAWDIAAQQTQWQLVVINPSLVLGPGLSPDSSSESFKFLQQLGDGRLKAGAPDFRFGVVDVRDVAEAHLRAAFLPEAEGRHIVSGHTTSLLEMADVLRPAYGAYPLPRRVLPKWLVWLAGPLADRNTTRRIVARNVGWPWKADNGKSMRALGLSFRPLHATVADMFQQMIDNGRIPACGSEAGRMTSPDTPVTSS